MSLREAIHALDVAAVGRQILGADLAQVDLLGRGLLHEVCNAAPRDPRAAAVIARVLVRQGAPSNLRDRFGQTPLDVANDRGAGTYMGQAMAQGLAHWLRDRFHVTKAAERVRL